MKIKDLIAELSKFNPEAEALTYIEEVEEYGRVDRFQVFTLETQDEMPYTKSCPTKIKGETVVIIGWMAPCR